MNQRNTSFSVRAIALITILVGLFVVATGQAEVRLPSVIGDNMVLQWGQTVKLRGWADPNEEITFKASWRDRSWMIPADEDGTWSMLMRPPTVGGPYELTLEGATNTIALKNILVGEVWVCSGQSNMQWPVSRSNNALAEIAAAKYPKIRLFTVQRKVAQTPQDDCVGQWVPCSPETVPGFSAVGYFFGRELYKELDRPIGLIHTSWGGTPAEAWTSGPMLEQDSTLAPILERYKKAVANYPRAMVQFNKNVEKWKKNAEKARAEGKTPPRRPRAPYGPGHPHSPSGLYNAMIAPLIPYSIRGAIWYQGESNASRAYQYRDLFETMIKSWWKNWGQGDFPFLFVQLANYRQVKDEPAESDWAELREAQTMALELLRTGMAVIIDIGEADNIHPKNKQDVGKRLALWALAKTYMKDVVYSGPLYKSKEIDGNKVILHFDHVDGGLVAKGGPLKGFAIAGADRKFVWADTKIVDDTVVVSSDEVTEPVAVRYAWADNPVCNLYNKAGLPASPFRTDMWPGITINNK